MELAKADGIMATPILIAGPPRSGTTMLAGLLSLHDVWIGRARTTWYPGTNSNVPAENLDIKEIMKEEAKVIDYRNWTVPLPTTNLSNDEVISESIDKLIPKNKKWLIKTSWTLIFENFWNYSYIPKWVLTDRSTQAIQDSMQRHPSMARRPKNMRLRFIRALKQRQRNIEIKWPERCIRIDVQKIANKHHTEIQKLFDFINIDPKWDLIDNFIEPRLFKRWKKK